MLAVRPKLMRLKIPILAGKCKQLNLGYEDSDSSSKPPEFRNCHVGFTDLYKVQKYREMLGKVEAKSLEPDIQV